MASLDDLPASPAGSTLIVIPYLDLTSPELERIGRYITAGGNLILADDYGYGNQVLAYLGSPSCGSASTRSSRDSPGSSPAFSVI